jgi:hypothetical protein
MRARRRCWRRKDSQSGYALLLIMFFLALLVLSTVELAPTVLSRVQREKEADMMWRGKQYVRGVRMYYTKMRRFPTSVDDLTKPKTGLRFMRQAYKDPMNQVDGSWRLIYVGPNGQLIGSLNNHTVGSSGLSVGGGGGASPASAFASAMNGSSSPAGSSSLFGTPGTSGSLSGSSPNSMSSFSFGMNQSGSNNQQLSAGTPLGNANGTNDNSSASTNQPEPLNASMDSSNTFGGNIIGVGSKIDKKSFVIFEKASNYRLFEFVWDPASGLTTGNASAGIGKPIQSQSGFGITPNGTNMSDSPFASGSNAGLTPGPTPTSNQGSSQNQDPFQTPNSGNGLNPGQNQVPPASNPPQ